MTIKELITSITKREWLVVAIVWFVVSACTLLPFSFAHQTVLNGYKISGIHTLSPGDMNVYFAYLQQARQGKILFNNLFTTETDQMPQLRIDWFLVGSLGRLFDWSPLVTYQVARVILAALLLIILYIFFRYFFQNHRQALTVFVFTSCATGVGMLALPVLYALISNPVVVWLPVDIWVSEAFVFLSLYHSPHLIFSWILILSVYIFMLFVLNESLLSRQKLGYSIVAGVLGLVLFLAHPFHVLPVVIILGVYTLLAVLTKKISWYDVWYVAIFYSISFLGVLYHWWYVVSDWTIYLKAIQNFTPTPYLPMLLVGFSLALPIAIWRVYQIVKSREVFTRRDLFLTVWLIVQMALVFAPFHWQRRMLQGWQIVLYVFAFDWWFARHNRSRDKTKHTIVWLFITLFLFLPGTLFVISRDSEYYADARYNYYYSSELKNAFLWIENNTDPNARFMATQWVSNYIPGAAGRYTYVGHPIETMFYPMKHELMKRFYRGTLELKVDPQVWLLEQHIDYVMYTGYERTIGDGFDISKYGLVPVFTNKEVTIYSVSSYVQ